MSNANFQDVSEYNDVQVLNAYKTLVETQKYDKQTFLEVCNKIARDHARTPMQWNRGANAGFSEGEKMWLKVNENYKKVNVEAQENDENSILNYYKKMIQLRKNTPALIYGDYQDLRPDCNNIWLYSREYEEKKILVMNNFTDENQAFEADFLINTKELVLANIEVKNEISNQRYELKPYESRVYLVQNNN